MRLQFAWIWLSFHPQVVEVGEPALTFVRAFALAPPRVCGEIMKAEMIVRGRLGSVFTSCGAVDVI